MSIKESFCDEWRSMFSGHFVPYHKLGFLVATITSVLFACFIAHDIVFEAPVAVIDLDHSRYSAEMVRSLDASPLLSVRDVRHTPADPLKLTKHDYIQAVIFLPKGLEQSVLRGDKTVNIGIWSDDTNTSQNGELIGELNEVVMELGAEIAIHRVNGVSSLGLNDNETEAAMSPMRVATRYLTNPTSQGTTATLINFLFFFSVMYQGMTSLMIIGRLRVTDVWKTQVLTGSFWDLVGRLLPYALVLTTAVTVLMSILILFGQLRFAGNIFLFLIGFFFAAVANGILSMLLSWKCSNPGEGASFMIWLVPPGFVLGGATMAQGFLNVGVREIANGVPLVWIFKFWRDIGLRGLTALESAGLFGWFTLYLVGLLLLLFIRFIREERKHREEVRAMWREVREIKTPT